MVDAEAGGGMAIITNEYVSVVDGDLETGVTGDMIIVSTVLESDIEVEASLILTFDASVFGAIVVSVGTMVSLTGGASVVEDESGIGTADALTADAKYDVADVSIGVAVNMTNDSADVEIVVGVVAAVSTTIDDGSVVVGGIGVGAEVSIIDDVLVVWTDVVVVGTETITRVSVDENEIGTNFLVNISDDVSEVVTEIVGGGKVVVTSDILEVEGDTGEGVEVTISNDVSMMCTEVGVGVPMTMTDLTVVESERDVIVPVTDAIEVWTEVEPKLSNSTNESNVLKADVGVRVEISITDTLAVESMLNVNISFNMSGVDVPVVDIDVPVVEAEVRPGVDISMTDKVSMVDADIRNGVSTIMTDELVVDTEEESIVLVIITIGISMFGTGIGDIVAFDEIDNVSVVETEVRVSAADSITDRVCAAISISDDVSIV